MKILRLICIALFLSAILPVCQAQRVLFSQDFDSYPQVNFSYPWASTGGSSAFPWRSDVIYNTFGLGYINFPNATRMATTRSFGNNDDVMLLTPPINLSGTSYAWLSYETYFLGYQSGGKTESATVELSTDNGTTWHVLQRSPVSPANAMRRSFVNLSAYTNNIVKLGFRYSDSLQPMIGWAVDNLKVIIPADRDISLLHVEPADSLLAYRAIPGSQTISGSVINYGSQPITAFDVFYQEANGPSQSYSVTRVNIQPFDTFDFVHSVPYPVVSMGRHALKVWVTAVGDSTHANDTLPVVLHGAQFMPEKKLVIEEGTGTWNAYAPRGYVFLHSLDANDDPPIRISVHSGDVMENKAYADYLYNINQNFTPYFLFDRRGPVKYPYFYEQYEIQRNYFGFASLNLTATAASGQISVDASVLPAIDLTGSYRLALVVTEDNVTGGDPDYAQANAFYDGSLGPMGGFENKPKVVPAAQMHYDYVARNITPAPGGNTACLPSIMKAGQSYSCNLHGTYPATSGFK